MLRTLASVLLISAMAYGQKPSDVALWKSEAEAGDAKAQFWLGTAYERGREVKQDFVQALRWLTKSATQDNADAQNLLGQMYEDGEGVPADYAQAARWYRAACENRPDGGGAGQGCNNLGLLYLNGHGVKVDKVQAYKYFRISGATLNLEDVKASMTTVEVAEAERQTQMWLKLHPDR